MKNLFILLIVVLGAMLTQTSCTTRQLSLANQSMQVYENYESQARIWKSRNPHKRSSIGAHMIKYGNIVSYIEWDDSILKNEDGFVVLYQREQGNWVLKRRTHPARGTSYSFEAKTRYGSETVRVVVVSGRIDVYMANESHQMR